MKNHRKITANWLAHALSFSNAGMFDKSIAVVREHLKKDGKDHRAFALLGNLECQTGNVAEGVKLWMHSVDLMPDQPATLFNLGGALKSLGRPEEALSFYQMAVSAAPHYADAHLRIGHLLRELKRLDEALVSYAAALDLKDDLADAWFSKGFVELQLNKAGSALKSFERVVRLTPDRADARFGYANALFSSGYVSEAVTEYEIATSLKPDFAEAYSRKGDALMRLGKFDPAVRAYEAAIRIRPKINFVAGQLMHAKMQTCDWKDFDSRLDSLVSGVKDNELVSTPFPLLSLCDLPEIHKRCAETHIGKIFPPDEAPIPFGCKPENQGEKIRVGYFSTDFHDHPVSHLVIDLLRLHNRDRFEIYAISLENTSDTWRQNIVAACDHFIDASSLADSEVVSLCRRAELDIAVDLNGYTGNARIGIFRARVAPVQVSYLGYLGTMGAPYFDYLMADDVIAPECFQSFYTEKLLRLRTYQCNERLAPRVGEPLKRDDQGLPRDSFVFCCFNNSYKITPSVFSSWMEILSKTPNSVLWLYAKNSRVADNLFNEARRLGIGRNRLIFAQRVPFQVHLNRLDLADLFLDTFPYNAGATASNALRMGLPVLTLAGQSFASRIGASLLTSLSLPQLIADSPSQYVASAVRLAKHPLEHTALRGQLLAALESSPLFDPIAFVSDIEAIYGKIGGMGSIGR